MHLAMILAAALLGTPDLSGYERILFPLHGAKGAVTRGASSSTWAVEEVIYNSSRESMSFYPYYSAFLGLSDPPEIGSLRPAARLDSFYIEDPCRVGCRGAYGPPGAIMWVERSKKSDLVAYDRVYETHSDNENYGAIVAAVPENAFRTGRTVFVDIPLGEYFRTTIRAYNVTPVPLDLTVRIYDEAASEVLEHVVSIPPGGSDGRAGVPVVRPGYTQLSLESLLPAVTGNRVRVELEPLTAPATYWAFATITSNSAQRVTVLTP